MGKRLTHLRLIDDRDGTRPKLWQNAVRYSLLYFGFIPLPAVSLVLFWFALGDGDVDWLPLILCIALMLVYVICVILVVVGVLNRSNQLPHGALSKTRNVSTLMFPEDMLSRVGQKPAWEPSQPAGKDSQGPMLNG